MRLPLLVLAACTLTAYPALAGAGVFAIDPGHSRIGFTVRNMIVGNVTGKFHTFRGTVTINDKEIGKSRVKFVVDTASIDTDLAERDKFLRGEDFFDVKRYPTMTFVSRKVERAGTGRLRVTGYLTLHGVTREVVLDVVGPSAAARDARGKVRREATAATKINRKDYGLTWNKAVEAGGMLVGDEVEIALHLELVGKR